MENMGAINPLAKMPGFDAMKAQQEAFMKAMTGGMMPNASKPDTAPAPAQSDDDLNSIKAELAALQDKLSKLGK